MAPQLFDDLVEKVCSRCHRNLGDLDAAEQALMKGFAAFPFSPTVHYELALVATDRGDIEKAVEHLETALRVWSDADDTHKGARRAREKLAELR